ncbi:MAG: oligosaccharide flippase family protein [Clostridia bacterium]|nr:oligosaccharide flippase family protein [Clostridia bacterium]
MQGKLSRTGRFFYNSLLMVGVTLLMRAIGVGFNAYVAGKAGAQAMGLYSLLSGVHGFAITLACSGIHLGTTRTVADALGKGDKALARKYASRALCISLFFGILSCLLLFFGAPYAGTHWLGDARTVLPLRILALTLPAVAVCSCLNGYFTAVRRVWKNAAVQLSSQAIRIFGTAAFLSLLLPEGVAYACLALVLGSLVTQIFELLFSLVLYWMDKKHLRTGEKSTQSGVTKTILGITLPVAFSSYARSGLITLQHILIPKGLAKSGASWESALASYGILHSMVLPVVLFPSAFISSFAGLLIPEVAEAKIQNDMERVRRVARRIFGISMMFSVGVAGVMLCFSHGLGLTIYNSLQAGNMIAALAPLIPIMYIDSAVDAVLKGMGQQVYSMNVNIADALTSVLLVMILVPKFGVNGYIFTIYFTEILNTTLSLARMIAITKPKLRILGHVFGPILCIAGATTAVRLLSKALALQPTVSTLVLQISLTALVYVGLLVVTKCIGTDEYEIVRAIFKSHRRVDSQTDRKIVLHKPRVD